MQSNVDLKCTLNREYLQAGNKAVVYLAMDISPPQAIRIPDAFRPLNVCITIDRSGSMQEEKKIENAKLATMQLIKSLKPIDYVSVISFSDKQRVEVSSQSADDVKVFQKAVDAIKAKGSTNIYSALTASFEEISRQRGNFTQEPVNRIILLTDGRPTIGKERIDDFSPLCEDIRRNQTSVTALGLGSNYNEQLLSAIASNSGGTWYHVTNPNTMPEIFSEELDEMRTVVMLKPELSIQPMSGSELAEIYRVRPLLDIVENPQLTGGKYTILLGDLVADQPQNAVAKVRVPARPKGRYRIAQVELASAEGVMPCDVVVTYTDDSSLYSKESDPYPRVLLLTSQGTILLREGVSSSDETVISQAQTILKGALSDPNALTVVKTNELAKDLVARFNNSYEATVIKMGVLSEEEKKQVISETTIIKKEKNQQEGGVS